MENNQISINPFTIASLLGATAFSLVCISIGGQLTKYFFGFAVSRHLRLFDLSLEMNIPTFFTILLLISASLLLAVITVLNYKEKNPDVSKWIMLSLGFLFMAYDEGFQVHEDLVGVVRPLLGDGNLGYFYYAWVVPGMALVLVLGLFFLRFLFRLPVATRQLFILAAIIYLSGCIGFELIGGRYDELYGFGRYDALYGYESLTYNMISTVEESLEMAGLIFFIYALLVHVEDNYQEVRFRFTSLAQKPELKKMKS
jgi:hypothetical protein